MLSSVGNSESDITFELNPIEGSHGTFKILQYSLLYADTRSKEARAASNSQWLVESFRRLTELYPISLGHRVQLPDQNIIIVSRDDRAKQRIYQHTEPQMTIGEFDRIKYRRDLWPPALNRLLSERTSDIDCLISAAIVYLQDGYLITLSVSHIIADASGAATLLQQWASLAAQHHSRSKDSISSLVPQAAIDFDHPAFWSRLTAYPPDTHPYVDYIETQDFGSLDDIQSKLATYYKTGTLDNEKNLSMRVLHVSTVNIAKIAEQYNIDPEYRPLHGVQILYALLWQRYVLAALAASPTKPAGNAPIFLNLLHNTRSLVSCPNYVGNGVSTAYISLTIDSIATILVLELAHKIKPFVNSITPGAAVHMAKAISDPNSMFTLKAVYVCSLAASHMTISNASRMPFYDIDFGLGTPLAVLWGTRPTEGMSSWLPHKDGIDINFGLNNAVYAILKKDRILGEFIDFLN
ncbi:hypothetical protein H4S02_006574 [Coemansia sp. RSA 2611]|nr:hypothetical protein IWW54_002276 [Coemansia sp. RSA 2705]KAJ2319454.1 hypothetical protein IWW52_001960 [Coemansia sp. RSA 2704]KAJ2370224.1 hypothetical protein H4S01_000504 [Coemansia sp. RSA 2610]KAJ2380658.1 hypothetical protein H4S02_006574 [Coemansia sp. RSA 2611]KAJ2737855.1 hypothetical protein H4R23_001553 [Coemansia sp. Cherry 401B]